MDASLIIHRVHFAFTAAYHYLFPQLTMGLALLIFILKSKALRGDEVANRPARLWIKVFGLNFVFGVVTDDSWNIHDRPILTLGVMMMVVGIQLFSIGLLGELMVKRVGAATPDRSYSVRRVVEDPADE